MPPTFDPPTVDRLNLLARYLAQNDGPPPPHTPRTVYVLAGSAILHITDALFAHLESILPATSTSSNAITLVIAGGIGHSTSLLYDAICRHPNYAALDSGPDGIDGLSEARIIERMLLQHWPALAAGVRDGSMRLLVDDKSTNCGQNAQFAKRLLDDAGIWPEVVVLVQDPTMSRRTRAGLDKYYAEAVLEEAQSRTAPRLWTWPTFVPRLRAYDSGQFTWEGNMPGVQDAPKCEGYNKSGTSEALWSESRFVDLLLGEIPRLRDDAGGYGPKGKGFIGHVDVPDEVEQAWRYLADRLEVGR